ncbi:ATP-binding cassette domain-containing protein [Saccharopolyspora halophila]|uniref:ATP-binding cassette domain-containing protein n=1 Tax=Saccharopolyspora halophila TaxID=405551 RepID=A0ABN3FU45_9PSEU
MSLRVEAVLRRAEFALRTEFEVAPGEVLAVLGPNGAGKSTLLSVLAGELVPDRGRVELDGTAWLDTGGGVNVPTHRRGVGLLAQQALLFPNLTARDNVAFGPRAAGMSRARSRAVADQWLSEVDATDLAPRRPGRLSGGQAQRVALARALAAEPRLLMLDEPLAALDVDAAPAMRGLLHQVLRRQGTPTVLVTHDVLDAVVLADRLLVLVDGEIIERGPTREVLARPREPFTARLAGLNLLAGEALDRIGATIAVGEDTISGRPVEEVEPGAAAAAVFAPSAVAVHRSRPHGSPRNALRGRVSALEPRGDVVRVRGDVEAGSVAADVTPAAVAELGITSNDEVWFAVKAAEVAIHPLSGGSLGA